MTSEKLRPGQSLLVGSLVFGLFFGAGNLIFPVQLGRTAGSAVATATAAFLITAVGLPVVGIIASALTRSRSVEQMVRPAGRRVAVAFTCLLYLTIGPLFAIPRTATVSFEVGVRPLVSDEHATAGLAVFSLAFFALTAAFGLRPGRILDWVGRYLTPLFLVLLGALVAAAFVAPMSGGAAPQPTGRYAQHAFSTGLIDGYNTMDALASLAFAIVILQALRRLGVQRPTRAAIEVAKAGVIGGLGMAVVYGALAYVGATSVGTVAGENGGAVLAGVSRHYYGSAGQYLVAAIVFVACLKTAIGLITACAEMFAALFPRAVGYRGWAWGFVIVSLLIANAGLSTIITYSVPVLLFLYPLAIVVILLGCLHPWLGAPPALYAWTMGATAVAATFDLLRALPEPLSRVPGVGQAVRAAEAVLPGAADGFGWVAPALVGSVIGLVASRRCRVGDQPTEVTTSRRRAR